MWLRALRSFFNAANHPLTDAERAALGKGLSEPALYARLAGNVAPFVAAFGSRPGQPEGFQATLDQAANPTELDSSSASLRRHTSLKTSPRSPSDSFALTRPSPPAGGMS